MFLNYSGIPYQVIFSKKVIFPLLPIGSWIIIASILVIKRIFVRIGIKVLGFYEITFSYRLIMILSYF